MQVCYLSVSRSDLLLVVCAWGSGPLRASSGTGGGKKCWPPPPSKCGHGSNFTLNWTDWLSVVELTWAWSERFNLFSRQTMIMPKTTETYPTYLGSGSPSGPSDPDNFYRLFPLLLVGTGYAVSVLTLGVINQMTLTSRAHILTTYSVPH
jgi:hypothetical protein